MADDVREELERLCAHYLVIAKNGVTPLDRWRGSIWRTARA